MPPLAMLAPAPMSVATRVAMSAMWIYLGAAITLVIVRVVQIALGGGQPGHRSGEWSRRVARSRRAFAMSARRPGAHLALGVRSWLAADGLVAAARLRAAALRR